MAAIVERVDRLEEVLQDFVTSVGIEFNKPCRIGEADSAGNSTIPARTGLSTNSRRLRVTS